jgi:hypothetical protein
MNIWSMLVPAAGKASAVVVLLALLRTMEHKDVPALVGVFGTAAAAPGSQLPAARRIVTLGLVDAGEAGEEEGYGAAPGNHVVRH